MIRIGTRSSPLALAQTKELQLRLMQAYNWPANQFQIIPIKTTGDRITDRKLIEVGGKGLFTKEIELALFDREIDIAVHSMKDVATQVPKGLIFPCMLPREDPRDAWICNTDHTLSNLPAGSRVGTSSLRRSAQVLHLRPDLQTVTLRGNVDTRINKIKAGEAEATLLALAGLKRLGKAQVAKAIFEVDEILPAVAQGALGVQCREDDDRMINILNPINDESTRQCVKAERAFLRALDGSCRTPIAALATLQGEAFKFTGLLAKPDGSHLIRETISGSVAHLEQLSFDFGLSLQERMP